MSDDREILNEVSALITSGHEVHGWKGNTNWYRIEGKRYPKWAVEEVLWRKHGKSFRRYVIKHDDEIKVGCRPTLQQALTAVERLTSST